jgi:hypothetical protein
MLLNVQVGSTCFFLARLLVFLSNLKIWLNTWGDEAVTTLLVSGLKIACLEHTMLQSNLTGSGFYFSTSLLAITFTVIIWYGLVSWYECGWEERWSFTWLLVQESKLAVGLISFSFVSICSCKMQNYWRDLNVWDFLCDRADFEAWGLCLIYENSPNDWRSRFGILGLGSRCRDWVFALTDGFRLILT